MVGEWAVAAGECGGLGGCLSTVNFLIHGGYMACLFLNLRLDLWLDMRARTTHRYDPFKFTKLGGKLNMSYLVFADETAARQPGPPFCNSRFKTVEKRRHFRSDNSSRVQFQVAANLRSAIIPMADIRELHCNRLSICNNLRGTALSGRRSLALTRARPDGYLGSVLKVELSRCKHAYARAIVGHRCLGLQLKTAARMIGLVVSVAASWKSLYLEVSPSSIHH